MANFDDININVKVDGIEPAIKKVKDLQNQLNNTSNSNPFQKYSDSVKGFTTNLGGLQGSLGLLPPKFQGVIGSVQAFSKALLANPLGLIFLAITAVVGALTFLGKAFISTDSGGLKFSILMKQISQVVDVVMNRIAELAKGLVSFLSGNFKEGIQQMGSAFSGLGTEISNATKAAKEYAIAMDELEDRKTRFISMEAELNGEIAKYNFIAADQTKSSKERMNALQEVQRLERQIADERIQQAEAQFNADINLAANGNEEKKKMMMELVQANEETFNELMKKPLYANLWDSKEFQDNFKKLEEGYAAVKSAQSSFEENNRKNQQKITGFMKEEAEKKRKIEEDFWKNINQKAEEESKKYTDIIKQQQEEQNKLLLINLNPDTVRKKYQILKEAGLLSQQEILDSEEKYLREDLALQGFSQDEINKIVEAKYKERLELAVKYGKAINEAETVQIPDSSIPTTPTPEAPKSSEWDDFWKDLDNKKELIKNIKQAAIEAAQMISDSVFQMINDSTQKAYESALDKLNKSYDKEYKNLEELKNKKLISEAEYNKRKEKLDSEKEKKEIQLKKEKAKKDKEAAIIQALVNTALSVTASLAQGGPMGIAMSIITGALGLIQVALIAAQPLAYKLGGQVRKKYAQGGILLGPGHDTGGIPILAEGGEFIIRKDNVNYRTLPLLNQINQTGSAAGVNSGVNPEDIRTIATEVTKSITAIPVQVVESDISTTQRKVSSIEQKASW